MDDAKVEEGLKKLRSLDAPLEAMGAIDTAPELVESGRHPMPGYLAPGTTKDGGRGTFIGHSIAEALPQPPAAETPYDDRMRGTLFGHMMHLPDLKLPTPEEPSSRELAVIDRSAPTSQAVEIYQAEPSQRAAAGIPFEAQAFPLSDRHRSIPIDLGCRATEPRVRPRGHRGSRHRGHRRRRDRSGCTPRRTSPSNRPARPPSRNLRRRRPRR